jgi:hypothetical protein
MSLDRLLGEWQFTMRHVAMPEPVNGRQRYERVLGGAYIALHWTYEHPDFPNAIALLDERTMPYFDDRGVTRVFDLYVDDSGWRIIRRDADFWQRFAVTFTDGNSMGGTGENSHDQGTTWEHDYSISYRRVSR